jgi:hypothetical protein
MYDPLISDATIVDGPGHEPRGATAKPLLLYKQL